MNRVGRKGARWLRWRQFYALVWKDYVVHKRHAVWTLLELTIPVLVCAMAILSNSHQGKPKLENERTFEPDDYERIYGDLTPARHRLLLAPNSSFTRALVDQVDDGALAIELCNSEQELVELIQAEIPVSLDQIKRLLPDENANVTVGGVVIRSDPQLARPQAGRFLHVTSKLDGQPLSIPAHLDMAIRAKDFRLGADPFPKKYSLGPFIHSDHYAATFFMASQIMLSRAYMNLLASYLQTNASASPLAPQADIVIPTNDDLIGQRMPYPKYVAHKRLKETTLGTFVAGSQKQKPFVLTMDYCLAVGFLVAAIFLAKRIVDEKKSRVRDMLRLVGISDWTYYASHMTNTMLIMLPQCALITLLFTGHHEAPAQNIDSSLLFAVLILYCLASVMFVLFLSTLFTSSTKAIIFTSLLWLGLPEVIDRVFKMNAGVIESSGFLALDERLHLTFALLPNFGLRLMNRLLTECDIYGEFFAKKALYGEYTATWPNLFTVLPLYKSITLGHIMGAMLLSMPVYALLIYLANTSMRSAHAGLANLGESIGNETKASQCGPVALAGLLLSSIGRLIGAPVKLVSSVLRLMVAPASNYAADSSADGTTWSASNLSQTNLTQAGKGQLPAGYLNSAFAISTNSSVENLTSPSPDKTKIQLANIECSQFQGEQPQQQYGDNDPKYFERAPRMLVPGVTIRNLSKTYYTASDTLSRIEAVKNVSLEMFYSQILGKFWVSLES